MDNVHDVQRIISKHQHSDGLIALYPHNQMLGKVSYDFSSAQRHATIHANVTNRYRMATSKGHYMNASGFDAKAPGAINIYSAGLVADFNGDAGALFIHLKTDAAWGELIHRYAFNLRADGDNQIWMRKSSTADRFDVAYESDGDNKVMLQVGWTTMDWFTVALMWDRLVTDKVRFWLDGVDTDGGVGLGTWAGNLAANTTVIGASDTTPTNVWDGGIGIFALYNKIKSDDEMYDLSTP